MARFFPENNGNEGYFGIGDWATAAVQPNERLDILDQTIRMRRLIPDYLNDTLSRMLVSDGTGRVHWRHINTVPGIDDCKWTMSNASPNHVFTAFGSASATCPDAAENVGIGTNSVDVGNKVTIRENTPTSDRDRGLYVKVEGNATYENVGVLADCIPLAGENTSTLECYGVSGAAIGAGGKNIGVLGTATATDAATPTVNDAVQALARATAQSLLPWSVGVNSSSQTSGTGGTTRTAAFRGLATHYSASAINYGIEAQGWGDGGANQENYGGKLAAWSYGNGSLNYGVHATTSGDGASSSNYGVLASAAGNNGTTHWNYGIHASATGSDTVRNWAGYFTNRVQIQGNLWHNAAFIFSDADLKTDVADIPAEEAVEMLSQLSPKTYHYASASFPYMNLPESSQFGFLAQEVVAVLPQLVSTTYVAEVRDSTGAILAEEMEVQGVNYVGMIPLLVAGCNASSQRMEAMALQLAEQAERLADLEAALTACCTSTGDTRSSPPSGTVVVLSGNERALLIQPNPFNERTTLYYTLERSGRMQLMANSSDGKQLRVLQEANLEAGQYQHEWATSDLSPGVYYVTLLLDGEPIVKKAVKVQR